MKRKAQALLSLTVNGHTLTGEKRRGMWSFQCDSWPGLAAAFSGTPTPESMTRLFMSRVLEEALEIREMTEE